MSPVWNPKYSLCLCLCPHGSRIYQDCASISYCGRSLISVKEGVVEAVDKVRTYQAALDRLVDLVKYTAMDSRIRVSAVHSNSLFEAERLCEQLKTVLNCGEIILSDIGPSLTVPDGLGIIEAMSHPV